jgi:dTDP-glucose 4,6-dehydratase
MKILVTGGAGFIGSNYIRCLLNETNHTVVNVDALTYAGRPETVKDIMEQHGRRYVFHHVDIRDKKRLEDVFYEHCPNVVVHFAAESHVDRSIENADAFVTTNVLGTYNMLEACRKWEVRRYVQVSSDEVYGQIPVPKSSIESDPLDPRSPYSASKASADLLVLSYHTTHGLPVNVTRCVNNYGPYQFPEKLIPLFVTNLFANEQVPVYGDGQQIREWIHVWDHNRAVNHILQYGQPGEIYNVGSGVEMSNLDITKRLLKLLDKDERYIKYVEDRKGHDRRYSIDCSKLRSLGWKPLYDFDVGLKETVQWYKNNESWWGPIRNDKDTILS